MFFIVMSQQKQDIFMKEYSQEDSCKFRPMILQMKVQETDVTKYWDIEVLSHNLEKGGLPNCVDNMISQ